MADYIPANADTGNGDWLERHQQEVEDEKGRQEADPTRRQAYTNEELIEKYGDVINAAGGLHSYSQSGGYTKDPSSGGTPTTYRGESGWYEVEAKDRPVQEGTAGADERFLSDGSYAIIQQLKQEYADAQARGDTAAMEAAHTEAERIRARAGYSGGGDGSHYLTFGELGINKDNGNSDGYDAYGTGSGSGGTSSQEDQLKSLLDQWKQAAIDQQNGKIDYAVAQAVAELERALEDAQPKFKEQAEAVARDEMQGLDNSALYAEARGDKGGIGQSQYNEIQAAAAKNRLTVQQEQTKLATDTARQIADLRAQGEFEKADAALEIAQSYLSQLIGLEQWSAEFGLSEAQFQESIRQWEAEYNLAMQQFRVDTDLSYAQLTGKLSDGTLTLNGKSQLADMGEALLSAGIMPSADQLEAMGMTEAQAGQYLTMMQLEAEQKKASGTSGTSGSSKGSGSGGSSGTAMDYEGLFSAAMASGHPKSYIANSYKKFGFTSSTGLYDEYTSWKDTAGTEEQINDVSELGEVAKNIANSISRSYGDVAQRAEIIERALNNGTITEAEADFLLRAIGY